MNKYLIMFGMEIVLIIALYVIFSGFTNQITSAYTDEANAAYRIYDYVANARMIGTGNDTFTTTPVSATINNRILNVKAKIQNRTGNQYEIKDFANMDFGGFTYPGDILFPADTNIIEANQEIEVEFEIDIHNIKYVNAIPTEFSVDLGTYTGPNKTYNSHEFRYTIAWGE